MQTLEIRAGATDATGRLVVADDLQESALQFLKCDGTYQRPGYASLRFFIPFQPVDGRNLYKSY